MVFFARDLPKSQLPTKRDVIEYMLYLHNENVHSGASRNIGFTTYFVDIIRSIRQLWQRLPILLISKQTIRNKLGRIVNKYRDILKTPANYIQSDWNKLFVICQCHCVVELNSECNCSPIVRFPNNVKEFVVDQCQERLLSLDQFNDNEYSVQAVDPLDGVASYSDVAIATASQMPSSSAGYQPTQEDLDEFVQNSGAFSLVVDPHTHSLRISDITLRHFCSALDRAGVSDRMGALLATSLLKDLKGAGIGTDIILDRNKIRRERIKARKQSLASMKCHDLLKCISFDGKRETALQQIVVNGKHLNISHFEEHVTMVKEPGSKFIGYVTPNKGDANEIVTAMNAFLLKEDFSLCNLVGILCDGTAINTGNKNGVICQLERILERPFKWLLCVSSI